MSSVVAAPPRPTAVRKALGLVALAAILLLGVRFGDAYLNNPASPRPHDFLQVWAAGRLTLARENPYDAERMFDVQMANRAQAEYASMMWVPPWGLAVAMPVGVLPINVAQLLWVYGQAVLIVACAVVLWRLNGGAVERWWVPAALAATFGPVWFQTVGGQYAGVLLLGVVGFLAAHRADRPILAGAFAALTALKPHLFIPLAIGLLIDAMRTSHGRRVVMGGTAMLALGALAATLANPNIWSQYFAATTGPGSDLAPGLRDWFNPTIQAWMRQSLSGRPFWVQCVPAALGALGFAIYWWKCGSPERWPQVLPWVVPLGLLIAPYGSWACDLTLLLVPVVAVAVRLDSCEWSIRNRWTLIALYAAANLVMVVMIFAQLKQEYYVWVAPVLIGCLLWGWTSVRSRAAEGSA